MSGTPVCGDCEVAMMPAKGYHAILAFQPPKELHPKRFSPVSLFVCTRCGQIRFYLARPQVPWDARTATRAKRLQVSRDI